ncbi:MAG: ferredoxin [Alphaproteobacteria bacterium HGW-Alphaproteobacteria-2]|nr:MAG: ferredoxin [Alphaproteobacteria bacterium HGW-Alphaproteobacteria-2]
MARAASSVLAEPGLAAIASAARAVQLDIFGAFHPGQGDGAPEGAETLVLLGPLEPGFWAAVTAAPEWADGRADPLDRWSARVMDDLAACFGAHALFPFGGPPHRPFQAWALASGAAWESPVRLLVHERAGLMASYRGALALPARLALPAPPAAPPCADCARPCLAACPVGALSLAGYDLPACHGFLDTAPGAECMGRGCAVRRACPVSRSYGRLVQQSAYHMGLFHRS